MGTYKREVIVDAIQWTGDNYDDILIFLEVEVIAQDRIHGKLYVDTCYGTMDLSKSDWIINTGSDRIMCTDERFKVVYKEVVESKINFNEVEIDNFIS